MAPRNLLKARAPGARVSKDPHKSRKNRMVYDLVELRIENPDMQESVLREHQQLYRYKVINEELRCENEDLLTANASLLTEHEDLEGRIRDQQQVLARLKKEAKHIAKANKADEKMLHKKKMQSNYLAAQISVAKERNVEHFNIFRSIQRQIVEATEDLEQVKCQVESLEHNHKVLNPASNEVQAAYENMPKASNGSVASTSNITLPASACAASVSSTADMEVELQIIVDSQDDCMTHVVDSSLGQQQEWTGFNMFAAAAKRACEHLLSNSTTIMGSRSSSGCTDDTRRASLFGWVGWGFSPRCSSRDT